MKLFALIAALLISCLGSEIALACEGETETSTPTFIQAGDALASIVLADDVEDGICDAGCCMMGCYCCSLLMVDLEPTRNFLPPIEDNNLRSSLLSAHKLLPLRPPIA